MTGLNFYRCESPQDVLPAVMCNEYTFIDWNEKILKIDISLKYYIVLYVYMKGLHTDMNPSKQLNCYSAKFVFSELYVGLSTSKYMQYIDATKTKR